MNRLTLITLFNVTTQRQRPTITQVSDHPPLFRTQSPRFGIRRPMLPKDFVNAIPGFAASAPLVILLHFGKFHLHLGLYVAFLHFSVHL